MKMGANDRKKKKIIPIVIHGNGILLTKKGGFNLAKGNAFPTGDEYLRNDHFFSETELFQFEFQKKQNNANKDLENSKQIHPKGAGFFQAKKSQKVNFG